MMVNLHFWRGSRAPSSFREVVHHVSIRRRSHKIWKSVSAQIGITVIHPAGVLKYLDKVSRISLIHDWEKEDFIIRIILIQITSFEILGPEDQKERIEGVERILAIRGEGDSDTQRGDSSVRTRRTPDINRDASSIGDLISWSEGESEPPLTCSLSTSEVMRVMNHTQSIERVVKMVTEASAKYFSQEKRDGGIRAQETSRRLMSKNESKHWLCQYKWFPLYLLISYKGVRNG